MSGQRARVRRLQWHKLKVNGYAVIQGAVWPLLFSGNMKKSNVTEGLCASVAFSLFRLLFLSTRLSCCKNSLPALRPPHPGHVHLFSTKSLRRQTVAWCLQRKHVMSFVQFGCLCGRCDWKLNRTVQAYNNYKQRERVKISGQIIVSVISLLVHVQGMKIEGLK